MGTGTDLLHPGLLPSRLERDVVDLRSRTSPLEKVVEQMLDREDDEHDVPEERTRRQ